jgi:predicted transcriptional regulator
MCSAKAVVKESINSFSIKDFVALNLMRFLNKRYRTIITLLKEEKRMSIEDFSETMKDVKKSTLRGNYLKRLNEAKLVRDEGLYYVLTKKGHSLLESHAQHILPENVNLATFFLDLRRVLVLVSLYTEGNVDRSLFLKKNIQFLDHDKVRQILKYLSKLGLVKMEKKSEKDIFISTTPSGDDFVKLFFAIKNTIDNESFDKPEYYHKYSLMLPWFNFYRLDTWSMIWFTNIIYQETALKLSDVSDKLSLFQSSEVRIDEFLLKSNLLEKTGGDKRKKGGLYKRTDNGEEFLKTLRELFDMAYKNARKK